MSTGSGGPGHVLVVGASAAGLSTVVALRRHGFGGRITVLGDEPHAPYDRPPLSKQILSGAWESARATLRTPDVLASLDAEFRLGERAVALDPAARRVRCASGEEVGADAVVLATGVRPRRLPGQDGLTGVHVLRSLEDAHALRRELVPGARLVVVGEGVLGAEIAATARTLGVEVTMTGPQPAPMALQVGPLVSGLLARLHTARGVVLRLGRAVSGFRSDRDRVTGVELTDGEVLPADVVVVAVGAVPATEWLTDSGLTLDDGVVCDATCRAATDVYAVGDVARWRHEGLGALVRLENRTNATEQAAVVAAAITGDDVTYRPVPYFWSDQFEVKLMVHGACPADTEVDVVEGDLPDTDTDTDVAAARFVLRFRDGDRRVGVLGWRMPKQTRVHRQEVVDALEHAARR